MTTELLQGYLKKAFAIIPASSEHEGLDVDISKKVNVVENAPDTVSEAEKN